MPQGAPKPTPKPTDQQAQYNRAMRKQKVDLGKILGDINSKNSQKVKYPNKRR